MIHPYSEHLHFPRRLSPSTWLSDKPLDTSRSVTMETITMKRQCWAFDGVVSGIENIYTDPIEGFTVVAGFRCERCCKVFFASDINDFVHECMDPEN